MLLPLSLLFGAGVRFRNFLYNHEIFKTYKAECPVISVGNLNVGGSGKTPFVIYLCKGLLKRGLKPVVLTRGYGRRYQQPVILWTQEVIDRTEAGDEPWLFRRRIPEVPVVVDSDRVRGAWLAIENFQPDLLIMDDGFQHRRLHRNLDILLWNVTFPEKYWQLLPAGLLREGFSALNRADIIVLTHVGSEQQASIPRKIREFKKTYRAEAFYNSTLRRFKSEEKLPLESLTTQRCLLMAGLGNPLPFFSFFRKQCHHAETLTFPDHHLYSEKNLRKIKQLMSNSHLNLVITTEKDEINLRHLSPEFPIYIAEYGLQIIDNEEGFWSIITQHIKQERPSSP